MKDRYSLQMNHKNKHFTFTARNLVDILSPSTSPAVILTNSRLSILVIRFRGISCSETFCVVLNCEDGEALFLGEVVAVFNRCI